ncbi:MAG TPA: hypothetical protein VIT23_10305 [Terrimicrobiaceae bacterium]
MRLVRDKLIPLRLLIPVRPGTHEWSITYRNLIFEMASFMDEVGDEVTLDLVRSFARRTRKTELLGYFSETEILLLMQKSVEYDLPIQSSNKKTARQPEGLLT